MRTIYKYKIPFPGCSHSLPYTSVVKHVAIVDNEIYAWIEVWLSEVKTVQHDFKIIGTGQPIPIDCTLYCGTVIDKSGVWHIYKNPTV